MDPIVLLRIFFCLMSVTVCCVGFFELPQLLQLTTKIFAVNQSVTLQNLFVTYGARSAGTVQSRKASAGKKGSKDGPRSEKKSSLQTQLDRLSCVTVPHHWFTHFYVLSVASSFFWVLQLLGHGWFSGRLAALAANGTSSMSLGQVYMICALMFVQGGRRLFECLTLKKHSASRMWFGHYLVGLAFYAAMGVAIWIEGAPELHRFGGLPVIMPSFKVSSMAPDLRTIVGLPIFVAASGIQHDCHVHLASLKKYSLPNHPVFRLLICPHYTAECLIYFAMAIIGAPSGYMFNWTILCGLVFVATNLGVTAAGTRHWYAQKFGEASIEGCWTMLPWIW